MKKLLLAILLLPLFSVAQITGTTKRQITVEVGTDVKTTLKIPSGENVDIIDANKYFFTILYKGNRAVVNLKKIDYNQSELNELLKIKTDKDLLDGKLTIKDIEAQKITDNARIADNYKYEIDHIRYCAGKFRNQIMTGYAFSFAGTALLTSTLFIEFDNPEDIKTMSKIGYGFGILGTILIIDSNKWMKRINVGPDGIGLRYKF
ncbi:MAG: hypothetical protein Q8J97_09245 [Flavobacteriaceae bacterium]|nr:hypothetical protein [Flavobacteriaceae bacterium]